MPRGVRFTDREKAVLKTIMDDAWTRKRGGKPPERRMRFNPKEGSRKRCPICKKMSEYRMQAGGWYCPTHHWFFPSDL